MKAGSFIKTGTIKKVSPNYFTGKASLQIISGTPKPKEADVLHVKFHKGARTKIHAHTSGQMLIVTGARHEKLLQKSWYSYAKLLWKMQHD